MGRQLKKRKGTEGRGLKEQNMGRGCRATGGGRKPDFPDVEEQVKLWALKERSYGHALNAGDLWREFRHLLQEKAQKREFSNDLMQASASYAEATAS